MITMILSGINLEIFQENIKKRNKSYWHTFDKMFFLLTLLLLLLLL